MIAGQQQSVGWGKAVVEALAKDLQNESPGMSGFSPQNLWYMRQFYMAYPEGSKLQPMVGKISWSKHGVKTQLCFHWAYPKLVKLWRS